MRIVQISKMGIAIAALVLLFGCVKDRNFDFQESDNDSTPKANTTYAAVKGLFAGETLQIQEDFIIEGYVVSSDRFGNFFSVLHFQDRPESPTEGFQIEVDLRDSHVLFPEGSKIVIKLKGLYLGQNRGVFKIGGVFTSFGNRSVGRLPASAIDQHIFLDRQEEVKLRPTLTDIDALDRAQTNTLIVLNGLELVDEELGLPFALEREETERTLSDCHGQTLTLLNSGFSDFHSEVIPRGNGMITGVLLGENDAFQLAIRGLNDLAFFGERCEEVVTEFTSDQIFISELADPNNNTKARFVELFNAGSESLSLQGWKLLRYTNDALEVGSTIDLSAHTIQAESTLVISPNAAEFENVYGFPPDVAVGVNSPADSNGDDNLQLVDPFGTLIDVFGVVGEDGSNTNHEFEDGRAVRHVKVVQGNSVYTFEEWRIFNDTGAEGTTLQVHNAPDDFTPGSRN